MKIVVLDGYCLNPGDLSWEDMATLGDLQGIGLLRGILMVGIIRSWR